MAEISTSERGAILVTGIRRYIGAVRRELVLELVDILRQTTPVKTGHARSNWIPKLGRPFVGVAGSRQAVDTGPQETGIAEIQDEPPDSKRVANLSNNVFYIRHLNDGSSQQAPTGFVQAAIAQAYVNVRLRMGRLRRAR